jgi:predicted O-methyltransferase YrrM
MVNRIDTLIIDSTAAITELCFLGAAVGTDKSPYNRVAHRHPYTAVYTMLFATLKDKKIRFAEIGVATGRSALLWDAYFTHPETEIHMLDRDQDFLDHAAAIVGSRFRFSLTDVLNAETLKASFEGGDGYDVIIDDSTHDFVDQIRIIKTLFSRLKPGGYLIVEDVFRSIPSEDFQKELAEVLPHCSVAYFVLTEHAQRFSPGWDNDRLLVLVRES